MTRSVIRAGSDTHVRSGRPKKNYGKGDRLRVESGLKESFLRFKSPVPANGRVGSAYLYLTQAGDLGGTNTISVRALSSNFEAGEVTWDDKPTIGGTAATVVSKTGSGAKTVWKVDIGQFLQDIANGAVNRGLSIRGTTAGEILFYSLNAESFRPYVEVNWSTKPQKPTSLKPSYGAISVAKWVQSCDYTDRSGTDALVSVRVQIDPTNDFAGGDLWDSGNVATDTPQLDLATTTYPGLAAAASTSVRMLVTSTTGGDSPWSDPVIVTRKAKGTVALNAPAGTVTEFTPPITWQNTGMVQTHYRVTIAKASNPKRLLLDTGKVKSAVTTYTVPKKVLKDENTYVVIVQVWDDQLREGTATDPEYVEVTNTFTVAYSATVAAPSAVTATAVAGTPWVDVAITRATSPDSWTVLRKETGSSDGYTAIETDIIPADIDIDATHWTYRDVTARPGLSYTYTAKAEVNGVLSTGGPTGVVTPTGTAVWLLDPTSGKYVILGGKDFDGAMEDAATTYAVLGAVDVVRTVMGLTGLSGSVSLMIRDRPGFSWRTFERTLYEFKSNPTATYRLVLGDLNIPVILGDVNPAVPHPDSRPDQVLKMVTFKFWQNGEHPFEVTF